jgi:hypothetical protein
MFLSPITVDARTPLSYIAEFKINYTQQDVPAASLKYSVEEWKRWRLNCKPHPDSIPTYTISVLNLTYCEKQKGRKAQGTITTSLARVYQKRLSFCKNK